VRGDAPSSLVASGICKKEPWEPQCFCSDFPHEAVCADPWGQALLVSTDAGVLLVDDDLPSVPVFDKTLPVKQMHVLETLDLLILRADKGDTPFPGGVLWEWGKQVAFCSQPRGSQRSDRMGRRTSYCPLGGQCSGSPGGPLFSDGGR